MGLRPPHALGLIALFAALPVPANAESGFFLRYGQSEKVWTVVEEVEGAKSDVSKINRILNENYGTYQTAFTRLGSDFDLAQPRRRGLERIRLTLSAEAAALGLVQNSVVPELLAAATAVGIVRLSWDSRFAETWFYEGALLAGWGIERRLSAVSTDLIEKVPFQKANVALFGADLKIRRDWRVDENFLSGRGGWKGTFYRGMGGQTSVALDRRLRSTTHAWELRGDITRKNWNLHGIFGSHPLPTDLLPRVWDRVANTNAWRELGAMSGAGLERAFPVGAASKLSLLAGFYGGYLGAEFRWYLSARTHFDLATYGIENSSAYRTLGQRVYSFATYLSF